MSAEQGSRGEFQGSCNCGGVSYIVKGSLRPTVACHCSQCRKQTGLYYAATSAVDSELTVSENGCLKWYAASETALRGFCAECGSALFWKEHGSNNTSILTGTLDGEAPAIDRHIFCQDKGDFYEISDGLPQFPQSD